MPLQWAEFSILAITKSIEYFFLISDKNLLIEILPGFPKISPIKSILKKLTVELIYLSWNCHIWKYFWK
ncbi:hypothetical protein PRV_03015 [Mycoplasma parvum str. Indiana]|uniref:Uncharacterized protein n=1 Tax=Mycoplasma parvum str. Indiana TaxID=1403316 RepID=U5NGG0_9MOLU|nr:hypothetical protein PRV_03015 [Mycoplasma parvum str. Indiana]